MSPKELIADLARRGISVTTDGDFIKAKAPGNLLTEADILALRVRKPQIIAELITAERMASAIGCVFCNRSNLSESLEGMVCDDCGALVWVDNGDAIARVNWDDGNIEYVDPIEIPTCNDCGSLCNTQTLADSWHCSRCDPYARKRRQRTEALLHRTTILRADSGTHRADKETVDQKRSSWRQSK